MSYKALYRKYRPKTFQEVCGQEHITATLENIIKSEKIGHAYLFAGPRGTGKTSTAHVFAAEINKTASGSHELNPLDLIEIDAASNNGVAEVRSLIESSKYAPHEEKYKIYIIDEVHMLTKGAFNALLKTLEEPPKHVIFILATTEPDRIPITVLSRLQRYNFQQIDRPTIEKQLKNVLEKEQIKYDKKSIRLISNIAEGGMRDALSLVDQAAAFVDNEVTFENISKIFGITSIDQQINLLKLIYDCDSQKALFLFNQFVENGINFERLLISLINVIKDNIIFQKTQADNLLTYLNSQEVMKLNLSESYSYKVMEILMDMAVKLKSMNISKQVLEIGILKMLDINWELKDDTKISPKSDLLSTAEILIKNNLKKQEKKLKVETDPEQNTMTIDEDFINQTADIALEAMEQDAEENVISEAVLITQEINLKKIKKEKSDDSEEKPLDLEKMFSEKSDKIRVIEKDATSDLEEMINLLVQADKAAALVAKQRLKAIPILTSDDSHKSYISLFESMKLVAKGPNFILLASKEDGIVQHISANRKTQSLIDFANNIFGEPTWVYAITLAEFETIKKQYAKLAKEKNLPKSKIISPPKVSGSKKTKEEEYGSDLFGSLFS